MSRSILISIKARKQERDQGSRGGVEWRSSIDVVVDACDLQKEPPWRCFRASLPPPPSLISEVKQRHQPSTCLRRLLGTFTPLPRASKTLWTREV